MSVRIRWAQGDVFTDEKKKSLYQTAVPRIEPVKESHGDGLGKMLWVIWCIFAFVMTCGFIAWTHVNPRMGFYAFNGWAPLTYVVLR
jgi:hypothetical protein